VLPKFHRSLIDAKAHAQNRFALYERTRALAAAAAASRSRPCFRQCRAQSGRLSAPERFRPAMAIKGAVANRWIEPGIPAPGSAASTIRTATYLDIQPTRER
jgi:hypothetical protein